MQIDQDKLKTDNATLAHSLREKARKHLQVQELYDKLKRRDMTAATQSAAYDSVDEVLQAVAHEGSGRGHDGANAYGQFAGKHYPPNDRPLRFHFRQGSNSSGNSRRMMPPPTMHRPDQATHRPAYRSSEHMTVKLHLYYTDLDYRCRTNSDSAASTPHSAWWRDELYPAAASWIRPLLTAVYFKHAKSDAFSSSASVRLAKSWKRLESRFWHGLWVEWRHEAGNTEFARCISRLPLN